MEILHSTEKMSAEAKVWKNWLGKAEELRSACYQKSPSFDPYWYNKTATVGSLVAAAGAAGFIALPEFTEDNRKLAPDSRPGRCDLYVASTSDEDYGWLFEFKVCWITPKSRTRVRNQINSAISCAIARDPWEAGKRIACCAAMPWGSNYEEYDEDTFHIGFAHLHEVIEKVDLAVKIDGAVRPLYLLFKDVGKARVAERHHI